ncbi:MAG: PBP1A family penicillin-binding protein [Myxococcales bacterium]|nr:PBP1A family penicillin-binding protein [Myxococcales bacterium]
MRRWLYRALALASAAVLIGSLSAALFYSLVLRGLPELYSLTDYRPNLVTRVWAADGTLIGEFARERREVVAIERIPDHVVRAFVSSEDDAFYEHEGLDYAGIARAAWANLRAGGIRQGGSTITQQVAKTFLLSSERSWIRKLKDMVLAMRIEEHLNKNEILFLYLNQIYLGSGAYGVQAASRTYFDKDVEELTIAEAALIAGLVPAPSRYTPFRSPERAFARQRFVLRRMREEGYITPEQEVAALEQELEFREAEVDLLRVASRSFVEEVRRYLVDRYGAAEVLTGGLAVRTSLWPAHQLAAYQELRRGLRAQDQRRGYRGPIRNLPLAAWPAELLKLAAVNGPGPWSDGTRLQGLVIGVDAAGKFAHVALGGAELARLRLEELSWAREPDPELDGLDRRNHIKHLRQALKPGYRIEVERTGERVPKPPDPNVADAAGYDPTPVPVWQLYQEPQAEGALVSIAVATDEVRAMVGGYSFDRSQYNRAVQSRRQPGSAFKPIVYAAALKEGDTPATIVYDTPIVYDDKETGGTWKPRNYGRKFYGPITYRQALAKSRNIATVRVTRKIGIDAVMEMARSLGIRAPLERNLGLALGNSEVTLAELVRSYEVFAAGGRETIPVYILEIRDREGTLLEERVPLLTDRSDLEDPNTPRPEAPEIDPILQQLTEQTLSEAEFEADGAAPEARVPDGYAIDPIDAYLMADLLRAVVEEGTGWRARRLRRPVAGKTGTTNNNHDAWFLGFTPGLVAGVWVGFDTARPLGKNEAGSRAAAPIWVAYMERVLREHPPEEFPVPGGIQFTRIDPKTGLLARPTTDAVFQSFREGTAPAEFAPNGDGQRGRPRLD